MTVDLFVIGGGINGCGIARDAAGRGYSVALAEMNDLASATSSASTKLFHGGLRYLEFFEFRLVREALIERETLLQAMPHISSPKRFVLPLSPDMQFDTATPVSKLLGTFFPWLKGRRPDWLIRLGLLLYDTLGGRKILPGTTTLDLRSDPAGIPLKPHLKKAYEYSDCWMEDARLVLLNARDAQAKGARIMVRSRVQSTVFRGGLWHVQVMRENGQAEVITARMLINAGGPWVMNLIQNTLGLQTSEKIRLVRGSHIIVPKLFDHDKCYFFQGADGRIIFAIPYEEDFTLIGTTDADHASVQDTPRCSDEEATYLRHFAGTYFNQDIRQEDIVWTYSGVRPLYDDGASSATAATRDYVLKIDETGGGSILNIFGGKITTYRRLAEAALDKIDTVLGCKTSRWTSTAALPGGDFDINARPALLGDLQDMLPFFDGFTIRRLFRQYGTEAFDIFADAKSPKDLGQDFGKGISARELDWAIKNEWVRCADDFLWRRSKLGLRVSKQQAAAIEAYISQHS